MKKFASILSAITLIFLLSSTQVFASNTHTEKASFEIKDLMAFSQTYGVNNDNAVIRIPVNVIIAEGIATDLVIEVNNGLTRATGTKNVSVKGNFYRTSDNEIVTIYGVSTSIEYYSNNTKITGKSGYHTSALKGWSGTYSLSEEFVDDYHISVVQGDFDCKYNNALSSSGQVRVAVSENGMLSVGGDYISYTES
ncbi:MAG: hypothetical protein RR444_10620 [Oscillospiraceae bacterium]